MADQPDYDNPEVIEQWCLDQRQQVAEYLKSQRVEHGRIGDWPAWDVAPYVSIWAVESLLKPGWVGWWVICGDLPTDYCSSNGITNPREVARHFAKTWSEVANQMHAGENPLFFPADTPDQLAELADLLQTRASILDVYSKDDSLWDEDCK